MDLNTIAEVQRPRHPDQVTQWRDGYAWLAGGTWLFSEPQTGDRHADRSRAAEVAGPAGVPDGLDIAATCRIAELYRFAGPAGMARGAAVPRVLQRVPGVVQDLERGDRRRQHLHVPAGRRR